MHDYKEITDYLIDNELISETEIYNYKSDHLNNLFEGYFDFCITNLKTKCGKYKVEPSSIFFEKNFSVNAKATLKKSNYLISINMGIIAVLYPFFTDPRFNFNDETFKPFEIFETECNISPEFLMFQFATQFTFYHELAHLIQKSEVLNSGLFESYDADSEDEYSLEHHVLEIDADLWGAHFTCYHLIQYFNKQKDKFKTKDNLENLFVLGLSSILTYFIFLAANRYELYYKKYLHPHPSIRISYMTDCFLSVASDSFKEQYQFDHKQILAKSFKLSEEMFKMKETGINNVQQFLKQLFENFEDVKVYIEEMKDEIKRRDFLLLNNYDILLNE